MKQQFRTLVILAAFFLMMLLMGCTSLQNSWGNGNRVPNIEIKEAYVGNRQIEELLSDAHRRFKDAGEQVHFANERVRRCMQLLSSEEKPSAEDRELVEGLKLIFERMSFSGQGMLAREVYEEKLANGESYQDVQEASEKLGQVLGAMVSRPELWEYKELRKLLVYKASVETDRQNLQRNREEYLKMCIAELNSHRQVFEDEHSAEYIQVANALYKRQKGKWLNWKWLGCWRDDVNALYLAADHCHRIVEGQYVTTIPYNSAEQLLTMVMHRMSQKERLFYEERHRNVAVALNMIPGYPEDNTTQSAEFLAVKSFREFKSMESSEKIGNSIELKDVTGR